MFSGFFKNFEYAIIYVVKAHIASPTLVVVVSVLPQYQATQDSLKVLENSGLQG